MKKVKEFQKVFLYKNENNINATIKQMEEGKDALNLFILSTERITRMKFDAFQKNQIRNNVDYIQGLLREKYPFKEADDSFNLSAMGLTEIGSAYHSFKINSGKWRNLNLKQNENGLFELAEGEVERINEMFTVYTRNEKQNEALEIAENLVKWFDKADEMKFLSQYDRQNITRIFDILEVDVHPVSNDYRIILNKSRLSDKFLI